MAHGKKYNDASRRYDKLALHGMVEAVEIVKTLASATFDETIEVAIQLGVDPRKPDQQVRGTVSLPAGTGKTARVAVFAQGKAVTEFKGGRVEYRTERQGAVVHVPLGKASFSAEDLTRNFRAVVDELNRVKPAAAKGRYIKRVNVSSTMGPGIKVDPNRLRPEVEVAGS